MEKEIITAVAICIGLNASCGFTVLTRLASTKLTAGACQIPQALKGLHSTP